MKQTITKLHNLAFKITDLVAKKDYKKINDDDVDKLAEAIELLNDVYEELYDKVFDDSQSVCQGTPDQL